MVNSQTSKQAMNEGCAIKQQSTWTSNEQYQITLGSSVILSAVTAIYTEEWKMENEELMKNLSRTTSCGILDGEGGYLRR